MKDWILFIMRLTKYDDNMGKIYLYNDNKSKSGKSVNVDNKNNPPQKSDANILGYRYVISSGKSRLDLQTTQKRQMVKPFFISVIPKVFQQKFKLLFKENFPQYKDGNDGAVLFNGSIYPENIVYDFLASIDSTCELPDILLTYDINGLYHKRFITEYLNGENFDKVPVVQKSIFSKTEHYSQLMRVIAYDALVIVIRKSDFMYHSCPEEWYELLNPKFKEKLILPGNRDFFCNTFFLHYVREFGYEAVNHLIKNTKERLHPEQMLAEINKDDKEGASIYVMPKSYALKIENKLHYDFFVPNGGSILIPIQLLVRKGAYRKYKKEIDFLTGERLGFLFEEAGFLSSNNMSCEINMESQLNWLGWDYIQSVDVDNVKNKISEIITKCQLL